MGIIKNTRKMQGIIGIISAILFALFSIVSYSVSVKADIIY
ncbi:MAG: hypothetical protein Q4F11_07310 [Eubacteriales bacterium]|nr:hypothetical protein [Eubacteriales bacterium]